MKLEHTKLEPVPQLVLSYIHLVSPVTSNNCEDVPPRIQFVPLLLTFLQTRKNISQLPTIRAYTVYHICITFVSYMYIAYQLNTCYERDASIYCEEFVRIFIRAFCRSKEMWEESSGYNKNYAIVKVRRLIFIINFFCK